MRFLLLAAALVTASPIAAQAQVTDLPPGDGMDIQSYRVEINPDFGAETLSVTAEITVTALRDGLDRLRFSPTAMVVTSAQSEGRAILHERTAQAHRFTLPRPLQRGETATVSIRYHGAPDKGVTFSRPVDAKRATHVFTDYDACSWLLCVQDAPGDKALADITLVIPADMTSLSIGNFQGRTALKQDPKNPRVRDHWRSAIPYSGYLMSFAAGKWVTVQSGDRLAFHGENYTRTNLSSLFGTTGDMLRFFEDKAGVPLPVERYHQLLIEGSAAQEAATYSTIGTEEIEPILTDPQEDWVIAHELAHIWWGNLVTCKNWDHFWLNEGITSFMVAAWKEHKFGSAAYDAELAHARKRVERVSKIGFDKPLAFAGPYPSLGTRRAVQYSKGALFMAHLRKKLGDKIFWSALKRYTRTFAGGTVDSQDFQRVFERESNVDLSDDFDRWVTGNNVANGAKPRKGTQI
jgi:aminopeptidase N